MPRYFHNKQSSLIEAAQPTERLSIHFKGPLESDTENKYHYTAVDEYSRLTLNSPALVRIPILSLTDLIDYFHYIDTQVQFTSTEKQNFFPKYLSSTYKI